MTTTKTNGIQHGLKTQNQLQVITWHSFRVIKTNNKRLGNAFSLVTSSTFRVSRGQ